MALNVSVYTPLPDLCRYIENPNLTLGADPSLGNASAESAWHRPSSVLDEILLESLTGNFTPVVNVTMEVILSEFEHFTEWYFITAVAAVGIASNLAVMVLLGRDKAMRPMSHTLHMLLLAMEVLYLAMVIVFIQFRHFYNDRFQKLQYMSYITMAMSFAQCASMWLLYVVATDAYRAVKIHSKPSKFRQLALAKRNVVFIILGTILFHIPYLPDIRVLLYKVDPFGFDPCNVPVEEHWEFEAPSGEKDLYYILYYSVAYSFVLFWVPFVLLAARDKDIIDLLHTVMDYSMFKKPEVIHACYTAKVVSIFCNVNLICISPKLVLLLFQMVDYALRFLENAQVFFEFFNVMANLLIVFKSSVYLFLFVLFHPRVKVIICAACCHHCFFWKNKRKATGQEIPVVLVTEPLE